jgi:hypothetical protein
MHPRHFQTYFQRAPLWPTATCLISTDNIQTIPTGTTTHVTTFTAEPVPSYDKFADPNGWYDETANEWHLPAGQFQAFYRFDWQGNATGEREVELKLYVPSGGSWVTIWEDKQYPSHANNFAQTGWGLVTGLHMGTMDWFTEPVRFRVEVSQTSGGDLDLQGGSILHLRHVAPAVPF